MHTPRALCLGLLVLSGSSLAANRSKEFCAARTKAASAGKDSPACDRNESEAGDLHLGIAP